MRANQVRDRIKHIAIAVGAFVVVAIIIWIDIATGLWNDLVVLSGLAAGIVTFILTALVLDRIIARSTAKRWAPVNRLALSEFLHALADEERSEISRGQIVPRELPYIRNEADNATLQGKLQTLRERVLLERELLSEVLSRWAAFLASSGDNEQILLHIADIALQLDRVRDAALEAESSLSSTAMQDLEAQTRRCNETMSALVSELRDRILDEDRAAREAR